MISMQYHVQQTPAIHKWLRVRVDHGASVATATTTATTAAATFRRLVARRRRRLLPKLQEFKDEFELGHVQSKLNGRAVPVPRIGHVEIDAHFAAHPKKGEVAAQNR